MTTQLEQTILVIFGGMGDLSWRKLAPALYNLLLEQQLPERFAVIGLDMKPENPNEFRLRLRDGASVNVEGWTRKPGKVLLITYPIYQVILQARRLTQL